MAKPLSEISLLEYIEKCFPDFELQEYHRIMIEHLQSGKRLVVFAVPYGRRLILDAAKKHCAELGRS